MTLSLSKEVFLASSSLRSTMHAAQMRVEKMLSLMKRMALHNAPHRCCHFACQLLSITPAAQMLVEEMSALMKCVALHNAPLLHQHSCRRMDSGAVSARDQMPPSGFYKRILVRTLSILATSLHPGSCGQHQLITFAFLHEAKRHCCICQCVLWRLLLQLSWKPPAGSQQTAVWSMNCSTLL